MKKLLFSLFFLLAGCAATGPSFSPISALGESEAVIYVYRPSRIANSGGYPQITLNGNDKGVLKNGGYLAIKVPPGKHLIEQQLSIWNWDIRANPVTIETQPKQRYFVRLDTDASASVSTISATTKSISITRGVFFGQVDEVTGMAEIQQLKLSN